MNRWFEIALIFVPVIPLLAYWVWLRRYRPYEKYRNQYVELTPEQRQQVIELYSEAVKMSKELL